MPLYRLLVQMRDEAHRFSRKLHHKTESKRVLHSWVDDIKGINKEQKKNLKMQLGRPFEDYKEMTVSDIEEEFKVKREIAGKIYSHLEKSVL